MKHNLALAAAGAALFVTSTPALADRDTPRYTSITVFGDSLVDAGNVNLTTGGGAANPAQGYFQGRFTNGYDYTDLLSFDLFGVPTTASLLGGTNFAYGGARATDRAPNPFVKDFGAQLDEYSAFLAAGNMVDINGLFVLNLGGNDVFNATGDRDLVIRQAAADYAAGVQVLNDLGARNILITGFPVFDDPLSFAGEGYLTTELAALNLTSDTSLFRFSYLDFFGRILTDPAALGLPPQRLDITCQQAGPAAIAGGCQGIFSFDGIHPTAAIHTALFRDLNNQFNLTGAVPEPTTWAMLIFGFGMVGGAMRRRKRVTTSVSYA